VPVGSSLNVDTRDQCYRGSFHAAKISILDARDEAIVLVRPYRKNAHAVLGQGKSVSCLAPRGQEWQNRVSHS
jgi:hypothetical protein